MQEMETPSIAFNKWRRKISLSASKEMRLLKGLHVLFYRILVSVSFDLMAKT